MGRCYQDAITLDEQTLASRERVLGPDHPDTLTSRNNLANGYRAVGRYQDAITLHEPTLASRGNVSWDPNTLATLASRVTPRQWLQGQAWALLPGPRSPCCRADPGHPGRVLGSAHPDTLTSTTQQPRRRLTWRVGRHFRTRSPWTSNGPRPCHLERDPVTPTTPTPCNPLHNLAVGYWEVGPPPGRDLPTCTELTLASREPCPGTRAYPDTLTSPAAT